MLRIAKDKKHAAPDDFLSLSLSAIHTHNAQVHRSAYIHINIHLHLWGPKQSEKKIAETLLWINSKNLLSFVYDFKQRLHVSIKKRKKKRAGTGKRACSVLRFLMLMHKYISLFNIWPGFPCVRLNLNGHIFCKNCFLHILYSDNHATKITVVTRTIIVCFWVGFHIYCYGFCVFVGDLRAVVGTRIGIGGALRNVTML